MTKEIGHFSKKVIDLLQLDIEPNTPIYIGDSNIEHIQKRHPYEYEVYFSNIEDIIANPDYIGQSPSDQSIAFVKTYQLDSEYIRVAVRIAASGRHYAKTLHLLILSILVYTFFSRMFDLMLPPVVKYSIAVA